MARSHSIRVGVTILRSNSYLGAISRSEFVPIKDKQKSHFVISLTDMPFTRLDSSVTVQKHVVRNTAKASRARTSKMSSASTSTSLTADSSSAKMAKSTAQPSTDPNS